MKLAINLLLGVEMQAIAEAVSLGEHLRIDRNVLLDLLFKTTVIPPAFGGKVQKINHCVEQMDAIGSTTCRRAWRRSRNATLRTTLCVSRSRGSTIFPTCTPT